MGLALTAQTGGELGRLLVDLPLPESAPASTPARDPARIHRTVVGSGVLLLALSWVMVVVLIANAEDNAALAAAAANVASVVATLLLMRGIRARRRPEQRPGPGTGRVA